MLNFLKTIRFYKIENGREYYCYMYANNSEKLCAYKLGNDFVTNYDWKNVRLTPIAPVLKECFASARKQFAELLRGIIDGSDGFSFAKGEHHLIAYRKELKKNCLAEKCFYERAERNDLYRFVVFLGDGNVYHKICSVEDFLRYSDLYNFEDVSSDSAKLAKACEQIRRGVFSLYNSAQVSDRYMYLSMKFLAGLATQEEADEVTAIDGRVRFATVNKMYDNVEILSIKQRPISFFNRFECYLCEIEINARKWTAQWYPTERTMHIFHDFLGDISADIEISDTVLTELTQRAVKIYPNATRKK